MRRRKNWHVLSNNGTDPTAIPRTAAARNMIEDDPKVALLDPAGQAARQEFLGWQCRIRQLSVRQSGGRPTSGMRPRVTLLPDETYVGDIVILMRQKSSQDVTRQFQHMVRKTRDPAERHASALNFLAAAYYQRPADFSDEMTALFGPGDALAQRLVEAQRCILEFEQFGQRYRLVCRVERAAQSDTAYQFTYWHNSLFNPSIPGDVQVLRFKPAWSAGAGTPPQGK